MSRRTTLWKKRKVRKDDARDTMQNILKFSPRMNTEKALRIANVLHRER